MVGEKEDGVIGGGRRDREKWGAKEFDAKNLTTEECR